MPSPKGLVPPQNLEAEKCVLGSILLDPECITGVSGIIERDDFYVLAHRTIYQAMLDLHRLHTPIDLLTVCNLLEERREITDVGGKGAVAELTEFVPTASHAEEYAEIVHGKAYQRRLIRVGTDISTLAFQPDADPVEVNSRAESILLELRNRDRRLRMDTLAEVFNETYDGLAAAADRNGVTSRFLATGFHDLDAMLAGIERSDLVILAARPAMGKTALAINIGQNIATSGQKVGVFSLEMSKQQLARRILSTAARVDGWKLRAGKLTDDERQRVIDAIERLHALPITIFDRSGVSLQDLRSRARRMKLERGLDFLIIDYLQLMAGNNPHNRVQEVSEISRGLKVLARELDVPILCLSQLSRGVESRDNKVPNLSDLRESGSIEQDADVVLMLYRDDYYNDRSDRPGEVELHVKKNRNGPTGKVLLRFDRHTTEFRSLDLVHTQQQLIA